MAWFKSPSSLLAWVSTRPLESLLYALGDGHCGIWALFEQMSMPGCVDESLDWFHLKENLYKVETIAEQLKVISSLLWEGRVSSARSQLEKIDHVSAQRFSAYLERHTGRIPNYRYYWKGCPLALVPLNRWSNKSMLVCSSQAHSGIQRVCRKC